jgi:hypothetical protein
VGQFEIIAQYLSQSYFEIDPQLKIVCRCTQPSDSIPASKA